MRRRILATILAVTATAIAAFAIPLVLVAAQFVNDQAVLRLQRNTMLAMREVPTDFADGTDPVELPVEPDIAYTLYDRDGTRISGPGPKTADPATRLALGNQVVDIESGEAIVVAVPIAYDETVIGALRAEQPTGTIDAENRRNAAIIAASALAIIAAATALGYLLAGRITKPVADLRDATIQLGTGDFAITPPSSTIPELRDTSIALDEAARRLDNLVTRERSLTADVTHQLRTPLTGLRAAIETELAFPRDDPALALNEALGDVDRLERTITELLTIARTTNQAATEIDLDRLLAQVTADWSPRLIKAGRVLHVPSTQYRPKPAANPTMVRHIVDIVLDNALIHGNGTVSLSIVHTDTTVTLAITDEGDGFAEPGQPVSPAHGHGLELASRLARAMNGRLVISRHTPQPRVELVLPRIERTAKDS